MTVVEEEGCFGSAGAWMEGVGEGLRSEPSLPTGDLELESALDSGHVTRIPSHVSLLGHVIGGS